MGVIGVLFYIGVIAFVVIRMRNNALAERERMRGKKAQAGVPQMSTQPERPPVQDDGQSHKRGRTGKKMSRREREVLVTKMMEDREHDWLAGQLAEERKALKRMSEMFDIRMSSRSKSWDAESLKRFHAQNCSAEGVDDPTRQ